MDILSMFCSTKDPNYFVMLQYGYVEKIPNVDSQTCPGEPPAADKGRPVTSFLKTYTAD